jgi:hypothetical protein
MMFFLGDCDRMQAWKLNEKLFMMLEDIVAIQSLLNYEMRPPKIILYQSHKFQQSEEPI